MTQPTIGVLLVNLGTPDSPSHSDVRRFLREFLSDRPVMDMHPVSGFLLRNLVILPFRPRRSAAAYRKIWTPQGSPLLVHGIALRDALATSLGPAYAVELAMRYGKPSIGSILETWRSTADLSRLLLVPLFPQYATAATGSVLTRCFEQIARTESGQQPAIHTLPAFYDRPEFISAWAAIAREPLAAFAPDHVLLSFHGLPESHIRAADATGAHCLKQNDCCDAISAAERGCYRAQCHATGRELTAALDLPNDTWSIGFQSRLGRTPWIRPYAIDLLPALAERGVHRLAVLCPAFVADCLETLEEIAIQMRERWLALGGDDLFLVPCPNAQPAWVTALAEMIRDILPQPGGASEPPAESPQAGRDGEAHR